MSLCGLCLAVVTADVARRKRYSVKATEYSSVPLALWALPRAHGLRPAAAESFDCFLGCQVKFGVFTAFSALLPPRNRDDFQNLASSGSNAAPLLWLRAAAPQQI